MQQTNTGAAGASAPAAAPPRARLVLILLILVTAVGDLPLAVANVALPSGPSPGTNGLASHWRTAHP